MLPEVDNFDGRTNQNMLGKSGKTPLLPTPGSPAMPNGLLLFFKSNLVKILNKAV